MKLGELQWPVTQDRNVIFSFALLLEVAYQKNLGQGQ